MIYYKDLAIGNYVNLYNGKTYQVKSIHYDCIGLINSEKSIDLIICDRINPIEVTEEILNKIGFKEDTEPFVKSYYKGEVFEYRKVINNCFIKIQSGMSNSNDRDWYCHIDNNAHQTIGDFDFQYLHELQNGIRLITKENLTINEL